VISYYELLVPALAAAIAMRAWMRRALPAALPGELLRAVAWYWSVALTVLTSGRGCLRRARREWGGNGRLLIVGSHRHVSTVPAPWRCVVLERPLPVMARRPMPTGSRICWRRGGAGRALGRRGGAWCRRRLGAAGVVDGRHGLRRHRIAAAVCSDGSAGCAAEVG